MESLVTRPQRIAFLGNYVPRLCGIATFTHDLCESIAAISPGSDCFVVAINDRLEGYSYPPRVRFEILEKDLDSYRRTADLLNFNNTDLLCVQHEFGIYGGAAGSYLLALLKEVRMPVVTTLHTVLRDPDASQRSVMDALIARSSRLVVMSEKGREILNETYDLSDGKLDVIPHGIPDLEFVESRVCKSQFGVEGKQVLLTFGLIGPGKGIEYAIEALPKIVKRHPKVVYLVLGATHPNLLATEGESYRLSLERLAQERGVKEHVIFYNRFVSSEDLKEFVGASDIYLTPYLSEAQVTSGTLSYVIGAGKAVISTPYWHAKELCEGGRGILVPFQDPHAIANEVCGLLDDPERMEKIRRSAYTMGREMIWPSVAKRYLQTFEEARRDRRHDPQVAVAIDQRVAPRAAFGGWTLASRHLELPPLKLDHIIRMSDGTGIFQHAIFNVPNFHEGYCTDDNARAYILCNLLDEIGPRPGGENLTTQSTAYLAFLAAALDRRTGLFRNFMSHGRQWLEEAGSEDSHGRALWALGSGVGRSRNEGHRKLASQIFILGLAAVEKFTSPRAWNFTLLGIHEYQLHFPKDEKTSLLRDLLVGRLTRLWKQCSSEDWPWFERSLTYDNARFSEVMILSGESMNNGEVLAMGLESLRWLASVQTTPRGCFRPIGSNGFYPRDGRRADFDQQPLEALAMISASHAALRATGDPIWSLEARRAFEWFLGRNDLGVPLYDFTTGGCSDGLHHDRVSENQGAESSLAFLLALAGMKSADLLLPSVPHTLPHTPAQSLPSA